MNPRWRVRSGIAAFLAAAFAPFILGAHSLQPASAQDGTLHVAIVYLGEQVPEPLPLSLVEPVATDKGLAGAKLAIEDNNTTGKFLKQDFELIEKILPAGADLNAAATELAGAGQKLIVSDLPADRLAALADAPAMKDAVIFNIRAQDDALRAADCRANVFHVIPSRAMKADALGQFLTSRQWMRWVLVYGIERRRQGVRRRRAPLRQEIPRRDRRGARPTSSRPARAAPIPASSRCASR